MLPWLALILIPLFLFALFHFSKQTNKVFYRVAGVDSDLIEKCTPMDKLWAAHIGAMLCLTFVIVFGVSYLAFDYIGATLPVFDPETGKPTLPKDVIRSGWSILIGFACATVIALVVALFDRGLFQSDWYHQPVYKASTRSSQRKSQITVTIVLLVVFFLILYPIVDFVRNPTITLENFLVLAADAALPYRAYALIFAVAIAMLIIAVILFYKGNTSPQIEYDLPSSSFSSRIFRVAIRLAISIFLASALSLFLELRLYETNIVSKLYEWYKADNKVLFDKYDADLAAIDTVIADAKAKSDAASATYKTLTDIQSGDPSEAIQGLSDEIARIQTSTKEQVSIRQGKCEAEKASILASKAQHEQERDAHQRVADAHLQVMSDENLGTNQSGQGSGLVCKNLKSGNCNRYEDAKAKYDAAEKLVTAAQKEVDLDNDNLLALNTRCTQDIANIQSTAQASISLIEGSKDGILNQGVGETEQLTQQLADASKAKTKAEDTYNALYAKRSSRIAAVQSELEKNPNFVPMQAGVIERVKAFWAIQEDPKYGTVISYYAWVIKGFVIFLEVIPVLMKMFFSPPSVYATAVKMATIAANRTMADQYKFGKYHESVYNEEARERAFRIKQRNDIAEGTHDDKLKLRAKKSSQTKENGDGRLG